MPFVKAIFSECGAFKGKETRSCERNWNTFTLNSHYIYPCSCFHFTVNEMSRNKTKNCPRRLTAVEAWGLISVGSTSQGLLGVQNGGARFFAIFNNVVLYFSCSRSTIKSPLLENASKWLQKHINRSKHNTKQGKSQFYLYFSKISYLEHPQILITSIVTASIEPGLPVLFPTMSMNFRYLRKPCSH